MPDFIAHVENSRFHQTGVGHTDRENHMTAISFVETDLHQKFNWNFGI